jgi:hypothetical protein
MKYSLLYLILFLCTTQLLSQPRKEVRVRAGADIAKAFSPQGFYRFPEFGKATLYLKGGGKNSDFRFNYNYLSGKMQFIERNGDTLDLGGMDNIDSLVFDKSIYYYQDGFLELVAATDSLMLVKKSVVKMNVENIGAYGTSNATGAIDNYTAFRSGISVYSLVLNQDVVVAQTLSWYWMDRNNNLLKANKGNLVKLVSPASQARIEAYLKANKTNFENEEQLKKLLWSLGR